MRKEGWRRLVRQLLESLVAYNQCVEMAARYMHAGMREILRLLVLSVEQCADLLDFLVEAREFATRPLAFHPAQCLCLS